MSFIHIIIHYCNGLLANAPSIWTDKLQRVLSAAARVITNNRKLDRRLTSILHNDLHCLDLPWRVLYKIRVTVYKSLHGMAPNCLSIWRSCAGPSPTSRGAFTSALQRMDFCSHLAITYQRTEDEPFLMLVHLPGILFQNIRGHLI